VQGVRVEGNGVLMRTADALILHQKFQAPLLLLTCLRRKKKTRGRKKRKDAKAQRREEKKERGVRR
jgi:hypothetical protein